MNLKEIYKNLGITTEYRKEVGKFSSRLVTAIKGLDSELQSYDDFGTLNYYSEVLDEFTFSLGTDSSLIHRIADLFETGNDKDTLKRNMYRLAVLLGALEEITLAPYITKNFHKRLAQIFDMQLVDLGYSLVDKSVIKKEASELDKQLIEENLRWLRRFPDSRRKYANALEHHLRRKYEDSITNAYSALEGLVKTFLGTSSRLDAKKTREELLRRLNLPGSWGSLLNTYCEIAHEFSSRHGKSSTGKKSPGVTPNLAGFFYT